MLGKDSCWVIKRVPQLGDPGPIKEEQKKRIDNSEGQLPGWKVSPKSSTCRRLQGVSGKLQPLDRPANHLRLGAFWPVQQVKIRSREVWGAIDWVWKKLENFVPTRSICPGFPAGTVVNL
jgi:hypothetical protein